MNCLMLEQRCAAPTSASVLPIVSAIVYRLNLLHPTLVNGQVTSFISQFEKDSDVFTRETMSSEAARLASFEGWPHMDYK